MLVESENSLSLLYSLPAFMHRVKTAKGKTGKDRGRTTRRCVAAAPKEQVI